MHSIKVLGTRWFAIFAALAVMLVMTAGGMMDPADAKPGGAGKPDKANHSHVSKGQSKKAAPHRSTAKSAPSKAPSTSTAKSGSGSKVRHPKGNTYQAQSDPDGMENGGVDQPGGQGGVNTSAQDGNNGSGNDIDCEDDNRGKGVPGHCKDKHQGKVESSQGVCQGEVGSDRHGKTKGGHVSHGNGKGLGHSKHEDCPVSSAPATGTPGTGAPGTETPGTEILVPDTAAVAPGIATPGTVVPDVAVGTPVAGDAEVLGAEASAPKAGVAARAGTNAQVKGVSANAAKPSANPIQAALAGVLPNTGAGRLLGLLLLVGLAALAFGTYTLATQRKAGRPTV